MKFIAVFNENCGIGDDLEDALSDLRENTYETTDVEEITFYQAVKVEVEVKIIQKQIPVQKSEKKRGPG